MEENFTRLFSALLVSISILSGCGSDSGTPASTTSGTSTTMPDVTAITGSGLSVSSNKILSTYLTNMCTQFTGEFCTFRGGQVVRFSDGTVLATGAWRFGYEVSGDTDSNENTISILIPSNASATYQLLSAFVARGSGYQSVFLVYIRSSDSFGLYLDTNADGVPDSLITSLTESNWS